MNGSRYVADAGAMIALLRDEAGADAFQARASDPDTTLFAHGANLAEVFYDARRSDGEGRARDALDQLIAAGILFRQDFDQEFWEDAARIKADYRRVSLADCFGLALARRLGCAFLSTDHHELDAIKDAGVCPIEFIR